MLVQIAKHRFFPATKRMIGQWHRDRHVHPNHANVDPVGKVPSRVAIAGKDGGAIAIFMIHRQPERLFIAGSPHRRQHRTKNFFFIDIHVRGDIVEQMRSDKKAFFIALQFKVATIYNKCRALIDA